MKSNRTRPPHVDGRRSKDAVESAITLSKGDRRVSWEDGGRRLQNRLVRWEDVGDRHDSACH